MNSHVRFKLRSVFMFSLALAAPCCIAGGFGWPVAVESVEFNSNGEFSLRVSPAGEAINFPMKCSELEVSGGYSSFRWFFFGTDKMTFDNHMAALRFLSSSSGRKKVFFGQLGSGLAMNEQAACKFSSRGLMTVEEDGETGIYSYYKWP